MKKQVMFVLFSLVFLGSFVSAYYGNSYGSDFSFQNLFYNTSPSFVFSLLFFLILFVFFNYSLSRVFTENNTTPRVISFSLSTGVIYWMNISNSIPNLNLGSLLSNTELPGTSFSLIVLLLFFGVLIYMFFRLKRTFFLVFGILFLILGLFNVVYESGISIILGILFILFWLHRRKRGSNDLGNGMPSEKSNLRQVYKQELADRRYKEKIRQAQIRARAKNIKEIGNKRRQK